MLPPRRHRDPAYARSIAGEIYGGTMRTEPQRAARALHAATRLGPRRGYYYQLAASTGWSSLPFLGLIRQPTLVLAGDDDPIVPVVNADRKSTRLNSSHANISYAVFCLKKKKKY